MSWTGFFQAGPFYLKAGKSAWQAWNTSQFCLLSKGIFYFGNMSEKNPLFCIVLVFSTVSQVLKNYLSLW